MQKSWLLALFIALLLTNAVFIIATAGALPERVASHFGTSGAANDYMTREGYRVYMLGFAIAFPLLIVAAISWLPRMMPNLTNIPNRAYWLAPERRKATFLILDAYALALGCLLTVLLGGAHWLLLRANAVQPPKLENGLFTALVVASIAAMVVWIVVLLRHFRVTSD